MPAVSCALQAGAILKFPTFKGSVCPRRNHGPLRVALWGCPMFERFIAWVALVGWKLFYACWDGCHLVPQDLVAVGVVSAAYLSVSFGLFHLSARAYAKWRRGQR